MAQKDKIKELVGGGLNAYHTKSLQQMDRIEKKNKQQNHKISILSNELDNDYLTKTEEGSVVSLEHSKEGMVYLDELQGNTLVNYCTDGSKELTLNGDIDVEGTFVTTTEGVDNGLVDVMCEGNTLVNLATVKSVTLSGVGSKNISNLTFKSNTKYTIIFDVDSNNVTNESHEGIYLWLTADGTNSSKVSALDLKGRKKYVMTRSDNVNGWGIGCRNNLSGTVILNNILILEGDWTDIETPPYFIGMKSVGQDDENGHKIEILSQNKNLFRKELVQQGNLSGGLSNLGSEIAYPSQYKRTDFIKIKPNTTYSVSMNEDIFRLEKKMLYDKNKKCISNIAGNTFNSGSAKYLRIVFAKTINTEVETDEVLTNHNIQIEEGNVRTDYEIGVLNKKEILLNEPLRGINDTIKDRFVKIGGKCYVERNCGEVLLDENKVWSVPLSQILENTILGYTRIKDAKPNSIFAITDKFKQGKPDLWGTSDNEGIYLNHNSDLIVRVNISKVVNTTSEDFKNYILSLNAKVIYQLATPIYEPLEINPELIAYTDVTHISNNSIIPCNMKIQNSGYNAIIKPSTLYTVALDTNKSGTIGMNLGGVKGTTTNNVLTLTTPATLTDDSLRLYGKGIKGSKVRLLEGDKTNYIPSFFEGMKSSFEDKLQDDGTYKMEILCNNKNLFDNSKNRLAQRGSVVLTYDENSKTYTVNNTGNSDGIHQGDWGASTFYDISGKPESRENLLFLKCKKGDKISIKAKGTFSRIHIMERNNYNSTTKSFTYNQQEVVHTISHECSTRLEIIFMHPILGTTFTVKDIQIGYLDKVFENYIENRHNKIQFSSIEPLRSVGNTKDKFVFKNNKLMIERNIGEITIKDTILSTSKSSDTNRTYTTRFILDKKLFPNIKLQTGNTFKSDRFKHTSWSLDVEGFGIGSNLDFNILNIRLSSLDVKGLAEWFKNNPTKFAYILAEPTYEEIPFELQKIILEGYENGTLFFDTNIPPTSTITYAGETPIVKSVRLNKTEVLNNTNDINDNIIPYLMDMDYRVVCLELATETQGISMARLFGGVYEMLKRDILSKRYSVDEYRHRLDAYLSVNKITEKEYEELGEMLNE